MAISWKSIEASNCIGRKYIDKSIFRYGIHIPLDYREGFIEHLNVDEIKLGKSENIKLIFDDYVANVEIRNINSQGRSETIQIRYDGNKEFKEYLKKKFKYTDSLVEKEEKNINTDEYLEIFKSDELNNFYIKCNIHMEETLLDNTSKEYIDLKDSIDLCENEYMEVLDDNEGSNIIQENDYEYLINPKIILNFAKNYIENQGYNYTQEQLSNLYLSLKTKPFVILAGISGTGKSKIVRLLAESLGATTENGQFNMISVKPDFNDA
ncbi:MAG: hypothetical protein ACRC3Y_09420, partial [Romboutsia sp.]|uniref:hypothetical protein n=1 Tax=Romboutsia sp. TaxID=1965302 RepID=UPI003F37C231